MKTTKEQDRFRRMHAAIADSIRENGRFVLMVAASPPFLYTVGNQSHGLPELLLIGLASSAAAALNSLSQKLIERGASFDDDELVSLGGRFPVKIITADERARRDYTIQATVHYGTEDYTVQQVIACDRNGYFPDDPRCQPPYSEVPILRRQTRPQ
jgi:hypothetical protein